MQFSPLRGLIVVLVLVGCGTAWAGDPAVAASREARKKSPKRAVRVIMNEDLAPAGESLGLIAPNFDAAPPWGAAPPEPKPAVEPEAEPPEPAPGPVLEEVEVHDEEYWRYQMHEAEERIRWLRMDIEYARQRFLILRLGLVVPGDPMREFNRRTDTDEVMQLIAALESKLVGALAEPAKIRERGRRESALPGWFR